MQRKLRLCAAFAFAFAVVVTVVSAASASGSGRDAPPGTPRGWTPRGWSAHSVTDAQADSSRVARAAAIAVAKARGISIQEARSRLARQYTLGRKGVRLEASLNGRTGGSYLDASGQLVVTTLDAKSSAAVRRRGARAQLVDDSSSRLDAIMNALNRHASKAGAGAVQGWYVDVPTNTVVVTVTKGATDPRTQALTKLANTFGASVRIEYRPAEQAPRVANSLIGGLEIVEPDGIHVCSVGFNTLDGLNRNVVLTAGHCVKQSGTVSRSGYAIGSTRTADFPTDDFGTFWNSYPSYWQPFASVYLYDGTSTTLAGQWDNPPVGTTICKSGRTTGLTCGTIKAVNQTVSYPEGIIYGLVRHTACVEGGDSGGANISGYGSYALGVTSGASTSYDKCRSKLGGTNISWYQPIGEALSRNGLRLLR